MNRISILFLALFTFNCTQTAQEKYAHTKAEWIPEVNQMLALDSLETYPDDAILCIGSSSIRLWKTMQEDLAPYSSIRRGYGGARYSDLIHFTEQIVYPHNFQALVIFVANDITGGELDKEPKEVLYLFNEIVSIVRKKYPTVPIFSVSITATPLRWKAWPKIKESNSLVQSYCSETPNMYFIDTESSFINSDKQPIPELFIEDQLHLNPSGYEIWSSLIKADLDKVLLNN